MRNVKGLPQLRRAFKKAQTQHAMGAARGIKAVGKMFLAKSNKIVPIDTGDLLQSGYVTSAGTGFRTVVEVGYTAEHAVEVHEEAWKAHGDDYNVKYAEQIAIGATYYIYRGGTVLQRTYRLRKPQEQAKFLETAVRENFEDAGDIVRGYAHIGEL